jgi:hypothetical protein
LSDDPTELVKQLGAPVFADREVADHKLRTMGLAAYPVVKAGLTDQDSEIRSRCKAIFPDVCKTALADEKHPVHARFREIVGRDEPAKKLYREMIDDPRRAVLLDRAGRDPEDAKTVYAAEIRRMVEDLRAGLIEANAFKSGNWDTDVVPKRGMPTRTDVATLLYIGSYPNTDKILHPSDELPIKNGQPFFPPDFFSDGHYEFVLKYFPEMKSKDDMTPEVRKLLNGWLAARTSRIPGRYFFGNSVYRGMREILPASRIVLGDKTLPIELRLNAMEAVANFGDKSDYPLFAALFDDDTRVSGVADSKSPIDDPSKVILKSSTLARDVAVGYALILFRQKPYDFGFKRAVSPWSGKEGAIPTVRYEFHKLGFDIDTNGRDAAHAKAKAWLNEQAKAGK